MKWTLRAALTLHPLQLAITLQGLKLLKVGGRLVYSTCSFNPLEDEAVVMALIQRCKGAVRIVDVSDRYPKLRRTAGLTTWKVADMENNVYESFESIPEEGRKLYRETMFPPSEAVCREAHIERAMRFLPHHQNTGGFFVCVLEKVRDIPRSEKEVKEEEKPEEVEKEMQEEKEEKEPFSSESNPEDPLKALEALETRFNEAEARAQKLSPFYEDEAADHHPVDALEYSAQVYVHEKDRAMIFRMYRQGVSPQEISQSFGYDEGRVVAILRLMQAREARKKAGIFTEKAVAALEASEDVFQYEYRDFPPANFKRAEKRREVATLPRSLPRFVFLNEEDEEAEIMKQVDRLVQRKRREKQPEITRAGLPVGKSERRRRG